MRERRVITLEGMVQGVGLRPYVHRLATSLDLGGLVRNDVRGVRVEVEGEPRSINDFLRQLRSAPLPLATIDSIVVEAATPTDSTAFAIDASCEAGLGASLVPPDVAICADCLTELFDPLDRRFRHPFITCTNCGPRYTIIEGLPYDRCNTGMAGFAMCPQCRLEYSNPADRRFHAQTIACPACGPALALHAAEGGQSAEGEAALIGGLAALSRGEIVAVKGIGGYHLACVATNDAAVRRLRSRKHREAKPFAVMVPDLAAARRLTEASDGEARLLESPARPIVLLRRRAGSGIAESVAPGLDILGVMLAYTPLHHLLLQGVGVPLVMTSGNRSEEPVAFRDEDARANLRGIADQFLLHDRPIVSRSDDSVARVALGAPMLFRRSRGYAPRPILLGNAIPPVLALGGHLKNTFCLARDHHAFLSPHIGDLDHPDAVEALRLSIERYGRLFDISPVVVAHDLHPDYASTRLASRLGLPAVAVQHHHAHVASCAAEHRIRGPVLGVALDGSGYGSDGAVWGGEFLLVEEATCERLGHLGYVPLPGGDAAAREPWRMALAHLWSAGPDQVERLAGPVLRRHSAQWPLLRQMLELGIHAPPTSSTGRLFDAVAALLGIRDQAQYEGQAAMELESLADTTTLRRYPVELREAETGVILDPAPMIRAIVKDLATGRPVATIAGAFHNTLSHGIVTLVRRLEERRRVRRVALTGGVFQNRLLLERTAAGLSRAGFEVLVHRQVPCSDGGLALGQAVVAGQLTSQRGA